LDGRPLSIKPVGSPREVNLVQYLRVGGLFDIPADVKPKTLTVKLSQNGAVKSVQTFNF
jgi:hypothetical protein